MNQTLNSGILNIRRRARYLEIIGCWFVEKLARETPKGDLLHGSGKNSEEFLPYVSLCIHPNGVSHTCVAFASVSMSVHACGVSVHISVCGCQGQRSMSAILFHYSQPIPLKQGLPLNLEITISMMLFDLQAPTYLCCPLLRLQAQETMPSFYMGSRDPHLGPHDYTVKIFTHRAVYLAPLLLL